MLRQEAKWTQRNVGRALGVARQTVSDWFMPNSESRNRHKSGPQPDARVTVNAAAKKEIVRRVLKDENPMPHYLQVGRSAELDGAKRETEKR